MENQPHPGNRAQRLLKSINNLRNPQQRHREWQWILEHKVRRAAVSKKIFGATFAAYLFFFYLRARRQQDLQYRVSFTRIISRMTGRLTSMPLPPYFRSSLYSAFGKVYGVNFDDILVQDLNQFRTFNEFFAR